MVDGEILLLLFAPCERRIACSQHAYCHEYTVMVIVGHDSKHLHAYLIVGEVPSESSCPEATHMSARL